MALLVRCSHCGAPHRSVSARERFVCDYCKGLNILHEETSLEELVCPVDPSMTRVLDTVHLHLMARGLSAPTIRLEAARRLPVWQIVSREGEEVFLPAALRDLAAVEALRPPALPLVSKAEALLEGEGPPALPLEISREEAEKTALATFDDPEAPLEAVRLIWLPVVPLRVKTRVGEVRGLYLEGAERLLLETIPPGAADESGGERWMVAVIALFAVDLLVGALLPTWPLRIAGLALSTALMWVVFRGLAEQLTRSGA